MSFSFNDTLKREIKIQRLRLQHPEYFNAVKSNREFKDIHLGERCFILGNGPSIKALDFSLLEKEIVFTVNQMPRKLQFEKLKTNYHVWADERFFNIDESRPEDVELLNIMKSVNTSGNHPVVFYKSSAKKMIERFGLSDELEIKYFNEVYVSNVYEALNAGIDLTTAIPSFSTVIQYVICIAIYMGFKEIYIIGCDCTGFISTAQQKMNMAEKSLYAYDITENDKKRMQRNFTKNSIRDELAWYVNLFDTYGTIARYAQDKNIKIYNAGEGGLLECYPRIKLNSILK